MKDPNNQRRHFLIMSSIFTGFIACMQVSAKEHSWILPGQCTPPELISMVIDRNMAGTTTPVLLPQDKLVVELKEAQLVLEVVAIEAKLTKIGWLWIGMNKVLSGSFVIENSKFNGPITEDTHKLDFERVGGAELKGVHVACSSDVWSQRVTFSTFGKRYALITSNDQEGESGRGDGIAPVTPPTPPDMRIRIRRFLSDDGDRP